MLYFFDVFGPSQGLLDRDKVPVSVFDLAQLLDELVGPVIVCQRARVFWTIVMVIVSRIWLSGFFVFWFVVVYLSCVIIDYCGCVVELIGTSPCIALYFPLFSSFAVPPWQGTAFGVRHGAGIVVAVVSSS